MGVISFSNRPEATWSVAGWAFRQILDDVISQYPEDTEMAIALENAKTAYDGLIIDMLEPQLAARSANLIRLVASCILSGTIRSGIYDQPFGDARTVEQYQNALRELLRLLPS